MSRWPLVVSIVALAACRTSADRPPQKSRPAEAIAEPEAAACDHGDDAACDRLTGAYLHAHANDKAAALQQRLCDSGRRYFCPSYALVLYEGRGIPQDRMRAILLFQSTCQYDPKGCGEYGALYVGGQGVRQDVQFGLELLELACRNHDEQSCRDIARVRGAPPPR